MASNLSNLTSKKYAKKFIEGADSSSPKKEAGVPEKMVRLNVEIPATLRQDLKKLAVDGDTTVRDLVLSSLESSVKKLKKKHNPTPTE